MKEQLLKCQKCGADVPVHKHVTVVGSHYELRCPACRADMGKFHKPGVFPKTKKFLQQRSNEPGSLSVKSDVRMSRQQKKKWNSLYK